MRKFKTLIAVAAATTLLSGCLSINTNTFHDRYVRSSIGMNEGGYPTAETVADPAEFVKAYAEADQEDVFNKLKLTSAWSSEEYGNRTEYIVGEYVPYDPERTAEHFNIGLYDVCTKNGGAMSGDWCFKYDGKRFVPLFKFKAEEVAPDFHIHHYRVRAKLVVPPAAGPNSSLWLSYSTPLFQKDSEASYARWLERLKEDARHLQRAKAYQQRLANKRRDDAFLLSPEGRGTKVCRSVQHGFTAVGFIEDAANGKVKINVVDVGRNGLQPGGFHPYMTWDYPAGWWICE